MEQAELQSIVSSMVDRRCHMLFDWIREPHDSTTEQHYTLFAEPVGPAKGWEDTNLLARKLLLPPHDFLADSVQVSYGSMPPNERERFREQYVLSFWILQKRVWQAPLATIPLHGTLFPANARELWAEALGDAPRQTNEMGEYPLRLLALVPFYFTLDGTPVTLKSGLRFLVGLNGTMDIAVQ